MNEEERDELIRYRIKRAFDTLNEVNILIENKLWSTAINRLYYACYYAIIALLLKYQIPAKTHAGVRQMFGLHFIKKGLISSELGKFYSDIFDKRQIGDYDDFVVMSEEDVKAFLPFAEKLIDDIEKLLKE